MKQDTVAAAYSRLEAKRHQYLDRYKDAAALTIPWLQPEDVLNDLQVPYQSMGARGVRNLSSKLMLALLPPGLPFFRMDPDPLAMQEIMAQGDPQKVKSAVTQVTEALRKVEEAISSRTESGTIRSKVFLAIMQSMVGGTSLFQLRDDMTARVYNLQEFVLERDPSGNVLRIITVEELSTSMVPEELLHVIEQDQKSVKLYTDIQRITEDTFRVTQEINKTAVETKSAHSGVYQADELPYIPIRFSAVDGESYGRSLIEENIGDLAALEGLSQAFLELSAAAARTIPLVDPTGVTRLEDLATAPNLKFAFGRKDDVTAFTIDKRGDMAAIRQEMIDLQESLKAVFLMTASIQRNAERVTAEEIRTLSQELEATLGGVYSILAEEFQLPLVRRIVAILKSRGELDLPEELLNLRITTGVEGVGRGRDAQALLGFAQGLGAMYGPQALGEILPLRDGAGRLANALGVDTSGFTSQEEMDAARQQAQQMAMMQQMGPEVLKQGGAMIQNSTNNA